MNALVTGGATRLGRECCLMLAERGYSLAVHYHQNSEGAKELCQQLEKDFEVKAQHFQADFSLLDTPDKLAEAVLSEFGQVDLLVNNASTYPNHGELGGDSIFSRETTKTWEESLAVNARAPFFLIQVLASSLTKSPQGQVINVLDESVIQPWRGRVVHSISKSCLLAVSAAAAHSFKEDFRVNSVIWGTVLPPIGHPDYVAQSTYPERVQQAMDSLRTLLDQREAHGTVVHVSY